jgi:acyl-coenzyme A thioesterase PaaI-like protein
MSSAAERHLDNFASIKWAVPLLESPDWRVNPRTRGVPSDRFIRDTIHGHDGMQQWLELYHKPAAGGAPVTKSVSLCKFGDGFMGYPTICHGGAVLTMMDEALGFAMIVNETRAMGLEPTQWAEGETVTHVLEAGRPLEEALRGFMVTASLETKFLRPVKCPGAVGIEVTLVENRVNKMRLKGIMKDGEGTPLVVTEGLFVKIRGGAKI